MDEYCAQTHCFNVGVAMRYSINEAIILNNLFFWVKKNEANNIHYHDGRYWTYNSASAFVKLFPYFSERQVRYTLEKLEKHGLILVGNYNAKPMDRTIWYALTDKAYELFGQVAPHMTNSSDGTDKIGKSNLQICEMELTNSSDGTDKIVRPIPDINAYEVPDENAYLNPDSYSSRVGLDNRPTLAEVRAFCSEQRLRIDPDRFFDVNESRGWVTKTGKPVDDWKGLAVKWDQNQTGSAPSAARRRPPKEKKELPSVEEVMRRYHCNREAAEEVLRDPFF